MKQEDFDNNFRDLRYRSAEYARQHHVWYDNARGLKRASELLFEQHEADKDSVVSRVYRVDGTTFDADRALGNPWRLHYVRIWASGPRPEICPVSS